MKFKTSQFIIAIMVIVGVYTLLNFDNNRGRYSHADDESINLPHGITIEMHSHENKHSNDTTYIFIQNGKVIDKIEGYYIHDFYNGDMDKDGVVDLIYKTYSGGAHCCFDLFIGQITPDMKKFSKISLRNTDRIELKDLDGDDIKEWIIYDDRYSYFSSLCFTCSPWVKIVATYKKGKLTLNPMLTKKYTAKKLVKLNSSRVSLDKHGFIQLSSNDSPQVINTFLYYFYTANVTEALQTIGKYFVFEGRGVKLLFLKELLERMQESYFWDDIRKINHFYDDGGVGMGVPVEFFDSDSIAQKLFERMEINERVKHGKKSSDIKK